MPKCWFRWKKRSSAHIRMRFVVVLVPVTPFYHKKVWSSLLILVRNLFRSERYASALKASLNWRKYFVDFVGECQVTREKLNLELPPRYYVSGRSSFLAVRIIRLDFISARRRLWTSYCRFRYDSVLLGTFNQVDAGSTMPDAGWLLAIKKVIF